MKNGLLVFLIVSLLFAVPAAASVEAGIEVDIEKNALCPCSTLTNEDFQVIATNLDSRTQKYEFELILPEDELWSGFIVPNESFAGNEAKSIAAFITPSCWVRPGVYEVGVKSISPVSGKTNIKKFDIEVLKCRWVEVVPGTYDVCQGKEATFDLKIVNDGDNDEKVMITASEDWLTFENDVFEIESGKGKTLGMTFLAPEDVEGEKEITLELASQISYVRNRETITANVRKCYETEFTVNPERQDVCPCGTADFTLEIKNMGLMEDQYTIRYGEQSSQMSIAEGGTGKVALSIDVPCDKEAGEYPLEIEIDSNAPVSSTVTVGVFPSEQCYNVYLYSEDAVNVKTVNVGESDAYEVVAANKGMFAQEYELALEAPQWVHMSDYSAELGPGESKSFFVYAAPEYETEAGSYPISVSAVGEHEEASVEFEIVVTTEFTPAAEGEPGITVESSVPTGEVVGEGTAEEETRPWSQIVMISILAVAVVFVLVLRFVVMMK